MEKTYRQITRKLRLHNGESERPSQTVKGVRVYTDEETLVTFDEEDAVHIPFLLSIGAIVERKTKIEITAGEPEEEVPVVQVRGTPK